MVRMVGAASTYCTCGLTLSWYVVAMVVGSLAVSAGVRAMSGRERPPMERSRSCPDASTGRTSRELNNQHTLISRDRRSILGEKHSAAQTLFVASFGRHF